MVMDRQQQLDEIAQRLEPYQDVLYPTTVVQPMVFPNMSVPLSCGWKNYMMRSRKDVQNLAVNESITVIDQEVKHAGFPWLLPQAFGCVHPRSYKLKCHRTIHPGRCTQRSDSWFQLMLDMILGELKIYKCGALWCITEEPWMGISGYYVNYSARFITTASPKLDMLRKQGRLA